MCMSVSLSMMMFIAIVFKKLGPIGPISGLCDVMKGVIVSLTKLHLVGHD